MRISLGHLPFQSHANVRNPLSIRPVCLAGGWLSSNAIDVQRGYSLLISARFTLYSLSPIPITLPCASSRGDIRQVLLLVLSLSSCDHRPPLSATNFQTSSLFPQTSAPDPLPTRYRSHPNRTFCGRPDVQPNLNPRVCSRSLSLSRSFQIEFCCLPPLVATKTTLDESTSPQGAARASPWAQQSISVGQQCIHCRLLSP